MSKISKPNISMSEFSPGLRNHSLATAELPVFDSALYDKVQYANAAVTNQTSFVRLLRIWTPPDIKELPKALELAEAHLSLLDQANLASIPHEWGLIPKETIPEKVHYKYGTGNHDKLLPKGMFLAARVAVVKAEEKIKYSQYDDTEKGYISYRNLVRANDPYGPRLSDLHSEQTRYGNIAEIDTPKLDTKTKLWFVDIEPVFH